MKLHRHAHASVGGNDRRNSITGAMPSMSERQMQAYLMARDAIRRVQRTSPIFDVIGKDIKQGQRATDRHRDCH